MDNFQLGKVTHSFHFMTGKSPRGKGIAEMLRKELQVPEGATEFSVRFDRDDVMSVECVYLPLETKK